MAYACYMVICLAFSFRISVARFCDANHTYVLLQRCLHFHHIESSGGDMLHDTRLQVGATRSTHCGSPLTASRDTTIVALVSCLFRGTLFLIPEYLNTDEITPSPARRIRSRFHIPASSRSSVHTCVADSDVPYLRHLLRSAARY